MQTKPLKSACPIECRYFTISISAKCYDSTALQLHARPIHNIYLLSLVQCRHCILPMVFCTYWKRGEKLLWIYDLFDMVLYMERVETKVLVHFALIWSILLRFSAAFFFLCKFLAKMYTALCVPGCKFSRFIRTQSNKVGIGFG